MTRHYVPDRPLIVGDPPPAPSPTSWRPEYGPGALTGDAAYVDLGARRWGVPKGARITTPDDGLGRVVLVLDGDVLHMLTAAGEVTNVPPAALSELADRHFGRPDARAPA